MFYGLFCFEKFRIQIDLTETMKIFRRNFYEKNFFFDLKIFKKKIDSGRVLVDYTVQAKLGPGSKIRAKLGLGSRFFWQIKNKKILDRGLVLVGPGRAGF